MPRNRSRPRRLLATAGLLTAVYAVLAYVALPSFWRHYEHQRGLEGLAMVTRTAQGIPGDPLNVGLVGDREDLVRALRASGWFPADPITVKTSIEIVGSVLLDRPYSHAPVSPLFYLGRREDLAFEKPAGTSADRRHHVRFWRVLDSGAENRPVWLGAATFDRGVGLSHYTGQVTHRIDPRIDVERDGFIGDLTRTGMIDVLYQVTGIGPTLRGRNGGGDLYVTDGEVRIGVLVPDGNPRAMPPARREPPPLIALKDAIWRQASGAFAP